MRPIRLGASENSFPNLSNRGTTIESPWLGSRSVRSDNARGYSRRVSKEMLKALIPRLEDWRSNAFEQAFRMSKESVDV